MTLVKTTGKGPDITPVCTSQNLYLVLVKCWISTERHTGETCCQLYRREQLLKCGCDSRFTLIDVNHTVFLHLTSLTAADSGNYTCECSYERETQVLSLNITVECKLVWSFLYFSRSCWSSLIYFFASMFSRGRRVFWHEVHGNSHHHLCCCYAHHCGWDNVLCHPEEKSSQVKTLASLKAAWRDAHISRFEVFNVHPVNSDVFILTDKTNQDHLT